MKGVGSAQQAQIAGMMIGGGLSLRVRLAVNGLYAAALVK